MTVFVIQETKTQYIAEIELCLDTSFHVISCPKHYQEQAVYSYEQMGKISMVQRHALAATFGESERCMDTEPVAYTVIHHD